MQILGKREEVAHLDKALTGLNSGVADAEKKLQQLQARHCDRWR